MVRRLHDIGKSGWYCAPFVVMSIVHGFNYQWIDLLCLPIYIISFSCFCRDSVAFSNAWGGLLLNTGKIKREHFSKKK